MFIIVAVPAVECLRSPIDTLSRKRNSATRPHDGVRALKFAAMRKNNVANRTFGDPESASNDASHAL
jgi:hypothetical protein